jgi:hypothetical protein
MELCLPRTAGPLAAVVLGLLLAAGPAVAACNREDAAFEDDFEFLDPSWGAAAGELSVASGVLVLKPTKGHWRWLPSEAGLYDDVTICVDAAVVETTNLDYTPIGVLFWFEDFDNFYKFNYWPSGGFSVDRVTRGQWLYPFPYSETLALKTGLGKVNQIEIRLKGKQATILINGTQVAQLKGTPPKRGSKVGLVGASPDEAAATLNFDNFLLIEEGH